MNTEQQTTQNKQQRYTQVNTDIYKFVRQKCDPDNLAQHPEVNGRVCLHTFLSSGLDR
jgi:hypothetical protein